MGRVLQVEDDERVNDFRVRGLVARGHQVSLAADAEEDLASQRARSRPPGSGPGHPMALLRTLSAALGFELLTFDTDVGKGPL
jgi:DNA-binding response OmpR family regulator